jgi:hypothetical protein
MSGPPPADRRRDILLVAAFVVLVNVLLLVTGIFQKVIEKIASMMRYFG